MRSTTEHRQITDTDSDISSVESDAQKVRLSLIDGQQSKPTWILNIPHDILITLSTNPRKWLCYAAYVICGIDGTLQLYNEHQELVDAELDGVVDEGDHFVYHFTGGGAEFVDRGARDRRRSQSSVSIRSGDVVNNLKSYYDGCPFTHVPLLACQCCHLIPHAKGSAYLRSVLRDRGDPDDNIDIDDPENMILMNNVLHSFFDIDKSIAFLATPNAFLKSNEILGNETEDPDKYLVTLHVFKRLSTVFVPHGRSSDMTQTSGLEDPRPERYLNKDYLPRNTLLDICYAVALLEQWGSEHLKLILDESAKKYYPGGGVRRGEDREGNMRREKMRREKERNDKDRSDRAANRSGNPQETDDGSIRSADGQLPERDDRILDSLLWAPYIFRGISPEEVEAKREEESKRVTQEEAERIGQWLEEIYEPTSELDGVGCEEETEDECPLPKADDGS